MHADSCIFDWTCRCCCGCEHACWQQHAAGHAKLSMHVLGAPPPFHGLTSVACAHCKAIASALPRSRQFGAVCAARTHCCRRRPLHHADTAYCLRRDLPQSMLRQIKAQFSRTHCTPFARAHYRPSPVPLTQAPLHSSRNHCCWP